MLIRREVVIDLFEVASNDGALGGGHYWTSTEHKLVRGPFATRDGAMADCEHMADELIAIVALSPE